MNLKQQLAFYGRYHKNPRNVKTHFIGVPLVVLGLFTALGWVRSPIAGTQSLSLAMGLFAVVTLWYFKVDKRLALVQFPVSLSLLGLGEILATLPWNQSLGAFGVIFTLGWGFQLLGHYFEGNRPALLDNFFQVLIAPLFLAAEVLIAMGFCQDLVDLGNQRNQADSKVEAKGPQDKKAVARN